MVNIPAGDHSDQVYFKPRLATSSQSIYYPNGDVMGDARPRTSHSFFTKLYSNLIDTIHEHKGRPLYLCKRSDYSKVSEYFDIIGRTRVGDWLVRPRPNVPNRPRKRNSKKRPAPKPNADRLLTGTHHQSSANGGLASHQTGQSVITTPFGAAERMPTRYLSGSNIFMGNAADERQMYTSLPRDLEQQRQHFHNERAFRESMVNGGKGMNERLYTQVLKKHDLPYQSPVVSERKVHEKC